MNSSAKPISAGLYLIATPIGNARDITLRALDLLAGGDVLAAEDTRSLRHLMQIHGLAPNGRMIVACHDHSGEGVIQRLVADIAAGRSVVYASEAGTPMLSDPGFALARAVRDAGLPLTAAPGASALLTALTLAGQPAERFAFIGFLPATKTARRAALSEMIHLPFTLVFYESPKRVGDMLGDLAQVLGPLRQAAVCRELTKRFEEVRCGSLQDLAQEYAEAEVKGEVVVIVGAARARLPVEDDVRAALAHALETMRLKDAATAVAGALGLPRREVYRIALGMGENE